MFLINYDDVEYEINKREDLEEVPTEALLNEYNQLTGKSTTKFASRTKGIEQIWPLIEESMAVPSSASRRAGGKRAVPISKEAKIKLLAKSNPKIPNTNSYDRFEFYSDGMTVGQYLDKGGRRADLTWDINKGFINVINE